MYRILICDDEAAITNALKIYLNNPDYEFLTASNGFEAINAVREGSIDLILLDIMMPVMDGITALEKIRRISDIPVIMLTAKSEDYDIINGLNTGADDYVTKPFNPLEVVARVNSQIRRIGRSRTEPKKKEEYILGGIVLNDTSKSLKVDDNPVSLTPKEFDILKLLISNPDRVFSPKEIYRLIWKEDSVIGGENTVAVHIRHIREKIEINPTEPRYIKVVFGQGYIIERQRN